MPIVVNPGFVWPPETEPVTSPDGRITAIVDPSHAGVLLRADFDDSVPDTPAQPEKVLRRNLAKNPSFETYPISGITAGNSETLFSSVTTPNTVSVGERSLTARFNGTYAAPADSWIRQTDNIPITPGDYVAMSAYVRRGANGASDTLQSRMHFATRQEDNTYIATHYGPLEVLNTAEMTYTDASHPAYRMASFKAPDNAALLQAGISFAVDGSVSGLSSAEYIYTDAWIVATGPTRAAAEAAVATYFDGDTPTTPDGRHYRWLEDGTSEEYTPATPFIPGHDATTARVRFERQDGTVVRSGNPAWAPGGYAHAYDHEATLGGGTLWRAVPIRFDGTEGTPSEYVGAVIPALTDGWAWLKPVYDPEKSMLLKVEPPNLSYDGRVETTSITGAPRPAATWDVLEGFTTQLRSLIREKDVGERLMALLDEGPVLAQFPACAGLPDFYFIRGKLDLEHVHWDGYPWRRYQWEVIQVDRPDTTDSPLRIPGLSYDTVARDWATYDQLKSTVTSYNKLLEP